MCCRRGSTLPCIQGAFEIVPIGINTEVQRLSAGAGALVIYQLTLYTSQSAIER
jgi:hypothetical protein